MHACTTVGIASLLESHVCSALDGEGIALNSSMGQLKVMETGSLLMQKRGKAHAVIGWVKSGWS